MNTIADAAVPLCLITALFTAPHSATSRLVTPLSTSGKEMAWNSMEVGRNLGLFPMFIKKEILYAVYCWTTRGIKARETTCRLRQRQVMALGGIKIACLLMQMESLVWALTAQNIFQSVDIQIVMGRCPFQKDYCGIEILSKSWMPMWLWWIHYGIVGCSCRKSQITQWHWRTLELCWN